MIQNLSQVPVTRLKPTEIHVSESPYKTIPIEVFGNCNQGTINQYQYDFLQRLRGRVRNMSLGDLKRLCESKPELLVKKGEEYDWINGLDSLEREFMGDEPNKLLDNLTVETVMRYNAIFSRFANDRPGQFRERDIVWSRYPLSTEETVAAQVLGRPFKEITGLYPAEYFNTPNARIKQCWVKPQVAQRIFNRIKSEGVECQDEEQQKKYEETKDQIDLNKLSKTWLQEHGSKGKINLVPWFKKRFHYFPLVATLPKDLEDSLVAIRESSDHPIEKACRIWLEIVRIHISHEANKRTGKALASVVMLSHGYFPPVIGSEDEKEYLSVLQKGIESKDGQELFVQFILRMMMKSHQKSN